jgi:predicted RNA-binding Zn-ribbon protein involved in translation (DUF1610 family)
MSMIEHKCSKCNAKIIVKDKTVYIETTGSFYVCEDCIEFIKNLK